jgi:hypothetical protein
MLNYVLLNAKPLKIFKQPSNLFKIGNDGNVEESPIDSGMNQ